VEVVDEAAVVVVVVAEEEAQAAAATKASATAMHPHRRVPAHRTMRRRAHQHAMAMPLRPGLKAHVRSRVGTAIARPRAWRSPSANKPME
jgi:hypothetical protein